MRKSILYSRFFKFCLLVADLAMLNISFYLASILFEKNELMVNELLFVIFNLSWVIAALFATIYRFSRFSQLKHILINLAKAIAFHILIITALLVFLQSDQVSPGKLYIICIIFIFLLAVSRIIFYLINKNYNKLGLRHKKYIIIGAGSSGKALYDFFEENQTLGFKCMGIFDDPCPNPSLPHHMIRDINSMKEFCLAENIEEIYYTLPVTKTSLIKEIAEFADKNFIYFRISPDFTELIQANLNIDLYGSIPIISIRKEPLGTTINKTAKRSFDILFSLFVICFIFPIVFPVIATIIKLESEGPVFFKQLRPGKKNQLFTCYKFRTMRVNNQTEVQASRDDSRITKFGRFLRRNSLDELPQFFNVLFGEMSVVGPRPNLISQLESYSQTIDKYAIRHFVSPGITGFAQIKGYRGETRQLELMQKRVEYDVKYMENWSFVLDLKIILITIWNMFRGDKNAC